MRTTVAEPVLVRRRPCPAPWLPMAAFLTLTVAATAVLPTARAAVPPADTAAKRWTDDQLVVEYRNLAAAGGLEVAVRSPSLPKDPPQRQFLEALSWYAAGTPVKAGHLTLERLDEELQGYVNAYLSLLKAKTEGGEADDYARTRIWKIVQKLTLLREEMSKPERAGRFPYPAIKKDGGAPEVDSWEREHTLRSAEEFRQKVCRASAERPVLVKYGNTNCTQCMLFEMIGSVKEIAEAHAGVDVYKVWWGFKPDASFAGKIRDPERLDEVARAEGVRSSPFFIVYRNGRRYACGDAFPDTKGIDAKLESCLAQDFGEAPLATACAGVAPAAAKEM